MRRMRGGQAGGRELRVSLRLGRVPGRRFIISAVGHNTQCLWQQPAAQSLWVRRDKEFSAPPIRVQRGPLITMALPRHTEYLTSFAVLGGIALAGSSYGSGDIFRSSDNGNNWATSTVSYAIWNGFASGGGNLYAATSNGVLVSTDNGATWNPDGQSYLPSANALTIAGSMIYAASNDTVYSATLGDYHWAFTGTGITSRFSRELSSNLWSCFVCWNQ